MESKVLEHVIDAEGKRLGRVASEASHVLMGKHSPHFAPNVVAPIRVLVKNANGLLLEERKKKQKIYIRYSGYPGGKKEASLARVLERKGIREVLFKAVYGMLPSNKLRAERMKRLTVQE